MLPLFPGREGPPIPRRTVLLAGLAGAVCCAIPRRVRAATLILLPVATGNRRFSVIYKGNRIGAHTVEYVSDSGETRVNTEIEMLVKVASFTMFEFKHRSKEIWRNGRLMTLTSDTVEEGEALHVDGAVTRAGFRVESSGGPFIASAATLTSNSLWTPAVLEQAMIVDAQHGGVIGVSARRLPDELIEVGNRRIHATRYTFITPYLAGGIWYDQDGVWVRGEFERDGSKIFYHLDT